MGKPETTETQGRGWSQKKRGGSAERSPGEAERAVNGNTLPKEGLGLGRDPRIGGALKMKKESTPPSVGKGERAGRAGRPISVLGGKIEEPTVVILNVFTDREAAS